MMETNVSNRWKRARARGVSPIIATILLVAITVVLAAVLYVLVSGLTHSGASVPYSIGMGHPNPTSYSGGTGNTTYWEVVPVTGTTGTVTLSLFGLSVENSASIGISPGTAPASCKTTGTFALAQATCYHPTSGWYVVLVYDLNSTVIGIYTTAWATVTSPAPVGAAMEFVVVSATSYASTGDSLNVIPSTSSSISGSATL